jgi:hypothetical protein
MARKARRSINPENIQSLYERLIRRLPYKSFGCHYHSFVGYFARLQKLRWVEFTGREEPSAFQQNYPKGQPRRYFKLTTKGLAAPPELWANPQRALTLTLS